MFFDLETGGFNDVSFRNRPFQRFHIYKLVVPMVPFLKLLVPRVPYLETGGCNHSLPKSGGSSVFLFETGGSNDISLRN